MAEIVDRTGWPAGEWDGEPDELRWVDEATQYACMAVRNWSGAWCGYVRLPAGHPLHGRSYSDPVPYSLSAAVERVMNEPVGKRGPISLLGGAMREGMRIDALLDVHGSLTYSGDRADDGGNWYGFDCMHCNDFAPSDAKRALEGGIWAIEADRTYRTLAYTKSECASLARQLAALESVEPPALPPLPEAHWTKTNSFSVEQMEAYARAAIAKATGAT